LPVGVGGAGAAPPRSHHGYTIFASGFHLS
jgi:hypothetical protein